MTGTIFNGAYLTGIVLSDPSTENPATIASGTYVTNTNSASTALDGNGAAWTVANQGTITLDSTSGFAAVLLDQGGTIANSGTITGLAGSKAIGIYGGLGTVFNYGTIRNTGNAADIKLASGGTVRNGASGSTAALIDATNQNGVVVTDAAGTVVNYATIEGTDFGVYLGSGGTVTNEAGGVISAYQRAIDGVKGASATGSGIVTVLNYGSIGNTGTGSLDVIYLAAGSVTNGSTADRSALISAVNGSQDITIGDSTAGAAGTVTNFGTIITTSTSATGEGGSIILQLGGTITNYNLIEGARRTSTTTAGAVIIVHGRYGTITNLGTITPTINGTYPNDGINLDHGGTIVNGNTSTPGALITGTYIGILAGELTGVAYGAGAATQITNYGTIQNTSTANPAIEIASGGTVTNRGLISSPETAIQFLDSSGTVSNFGSIAGTRTGGIGVNLEDGGLVINGQSGSAAGLISGYGAAGGGISVSTALGTVVNYGTIAATASNSSTIEVSVPGVILFDGGTVRNFGTITASVANNAIAVSLHETGTIINGVRGSTEGTITGYHIGVFSFSTAGPVGVINYGLIQNTQTGLAAATGYDGSGISLQDGGSAINWGTISGGQRGIEILNAAGTVVNYGTILDAPPAGGTPGEGIFLNSGGIVTNGSSSDITALISSYKGGVYIGSTAGGSGTITNFGTIEATSTGSLGGSAIFLEFGGTINNYGLVTGAQNPSPSAIGVVIKTHAHYATIFNTGTISSTNVTNAINLDHGGTIINGNSSGSAALISGTNGGIYAGNTSYPTGASSFITNFGTIQSVGLYAAIVINAGGTVTNRGLIVGPAGVHLEGALGTVVNYGTIEATGIADLGVHMFSGGIVTNRGLITSPDTGVEFDNLAGAVFNYATILSTPAVGATAGDGVLLNAGGTVTNGSSTNSTALISSTRLGVSVHDGGTLINYGTIMSTEPVTASTGSGVYFGQGGALTNKAGALVSAYRTAVVIGNTSATDTSLLLTNLGTITGSKGAVVGASDTAANTLVNRGMITGTAGAAASLGSGGGTILNYGTLIGNSGTASAVNLSAGGTVVNGGATVATATIEASQTGVSVEGSAGDLTNFGSIISQGVGEGVYFGVGGALTNEASGYISSYEAAINMNLGVGTVFNYGTVKDSGTAHTAMYFGAGGRMVNGSKTATSALIDGASDGIKFGVDPGTVVNYGTIAGALNTVALDAGGVLTNEAGGVVTSTLAAVRVAGAVGTVTNFGTLNSTGSAGVGVYFASGGALINNGLVAGSLGVNVAAADTGPTTIVNDGTITGTGGTAVSFNGGADTLVIDPKSVLNGALSGFAAGDTIDFAQKSGTAVAFSYGVLSLLQGGGVVGSVDLSGPYAAGEFAVGPDGNGGTDVTLSSSPSEAQLTTTSDFAGDGMSDVLWQNDNTQDSGNGQTAIWLMDGVNPTAEDIITTVPTSWHVIGTGDFYGTGDADILWQNDGGQAAIWEMNGTNPTAETVFASPPPSWHMIATGDFNGDGMSDVLWQYEDTGNASDSQNGNVAIWEMNQAFTIAAAVVAQPGPDWDVIGTGDFNGDGKSDILWQYEDSQNASDPQNGNVAIWEMNGLTPTVTAVVAQPGPDWHVVGAGDFNGDGMSDILWQYDDSQNASDPQNGNVAIWLMNGTTPTAEAVVAEPGSAWHAIGTGDYDGSGRSGILWQNTDGQAAIWLMNGLTPTTESVFAAPPSSWHVIPS